MKLEQAARQLLRSFESGMIDINLITALREALAEQATVSGGLCGGCAKKAADGWALYCVECWEQAEHEPVAWAYIDADGSFMDALGKQHGAYQTPLYAAPVRTKDLTDDEIVDIWNRNCGMIDRCRAVIQEFRRKNGIV